LGVLETKLGKLGTCLTKSAVQPFSDQTYTDFDQLRLDTTNSNFGAALANLGALEGDSGRTFSGLRQAQTNGDRNTAIGLENQMVSIFFRLCDTASTLTPLD